MCKHINDLVIIANKILATQNSRVEVKIRSNCYRYAINLYSFTNVTDNDYIPILCRNRKEVVNFLNELITKFLPNTLTKAYRLGFKTDYETYSKPVRDSSQCKSYIMLKSSMTGARLIYEYPLAHGGNKVRRLYLI